MESSMVTISALALIGLCFTLILRQYNKELSILITTVTSIFLLIHSFEHIHSFLELVKSYLAPIQGSGFYFPILCKVLITAYVADFTAQLCKDAGETSIAGKVELAGKLVICILASPILITILELITTLIPS